MTCIFFSQGTFSKIAKIKKDTGSFFMKYRGFLKGIAILYEIKRFRIKEVRSTVIDIYHKYYIIAHIRMRIYKALKKTSPSGAAS